jgi:hypothetical protein
MLLLLVVSPSETTPHYVVMLLSRNEGDDVVYAETTHAKEEEDVGIVNYWVNLYRKRGNCRRRGCCHRMSWRVVLTAKITRRGNVNYVLCMAKEDIQTALLVMETASCVSIIIAMEQVNKCNWNVNNIPYL